ncbi:MAG: hypothetical protein D3916_17675, partial [Candidatus Electrothrix sp. MAN1_4]|nr:hypothetical protein [Candidatus Electrothrix sp. MAN1_4]
NKVKYFSSGTLPIELIDNMYLSWLMFGGVFFFAVMLFYFLLTAFFFLISFLKSNISTVEEFSLVIFLNTIFVLIVGMFGTFWDNIQESFLFWYVQPAMMSYVLSMKKYEQNSPSKKWHLATLKR